MLIDIPLNKLVDKDMTYIFGVRCLDGVSDAQ